MEATTTIEAAPKRMVSEVFGISRELPLSYLSRPRIDQDFLSFIAQGRHVVVYGGSSQGKSSLIRKHLSRDGIIEVQCAPDMKRFDLYRLLLREAGVYVSLGRKKKRMKGVSAEVTLYREESGSESEIAEQTISIDLSNVNDIIRLLAENDVKKTIVLDDFHLLPGKTKRQVAADLRTIYDRSALQVVVIGAWRHEDKLTMLSGYLPARSHSINVDAWTPSELEEVIARGTAALNLKFTPELTRRLVELSNSNVGVLQQLCQHVCQLASIDGADLAERTLSDPSLADAALQSLVDANAGRYILFIDRYADDDGNKDLTRWIMHAIVTLGADALDRGLSAADIHGYINTHHTGVQNNSWDTGPRRPWRGRIDAAAVVKRLKKLEEFQRDSDLNPIALSYDKRRDVLRAVDVGLLLFLRASDRQELLARLPTRETDLTEEQIRHALERMARPPRARRQAATDGASAEAPAVAAEPSPAPAVAGLPPSHRRRRSASRQTAAPPAAVAIATEATRARRQGR